MGYLNNNNKSQPVTVDQHLKVTQDFPVPGTQYNQIRQISDICRIGFLIVLLRSLQVVKSGVSIQMLGPVFLTQGLEGN